MKQASILHWTKHEGKLDGLYSLSTSPRTNPFCASTPYPVCKHCYARRLASYRTSLEKHLERNLDILSAAPLPANALMVPDAVKRAGFARFHSLGELANHQHAENLAAIARANPTVEFTLWTKRPALLDGVELPANFHVIWSIGDMNMAADAARSAYVAVNAAHPFVKAAYYVGDRDHVAEPCGTACATCRRCYPPKAGDVIRQRLH